MVFAKIAKSSVVDAFRPHVFTILLHEIRDLWNITPFIWKKQNPFRFHYMRSFNPHVGSFHSPTWGYQKHNSYRVATPYSTFMIQYSTNCKTIFRPFIPHVGSFYSPTWGYQRHNSYRVAMPHNVFVMLYNTNYADNLSSIYSPRRLISIANVGLSKAQLVPSCDATQCVYNAILCELQDNLSSIYPHVGSFYSPTWGYQRHNSYRVATLYNAF